MSSPPKIISSRVRHAFIAVHVGAFSPLRRLACAHSLSRPLSRSRPPHHRESIERRCDVYVPVLCIRAESLYVCEGRGWRYASSPTVTRAPLELYHNSVHGLLT